MEEFVNPVVFGIVAFEFALDYYEYRHYKKVLDAIKAAPLFDETVAKSLQSGHSAAPTIVRGKVRPLHEPIISAVTPGMKGVVQRLRVVRYIASKNIFGLWRHRKEVVRDGIDKTSFGLASGKTLVHLSDKFTEDLRFVHLVKTGDKIKTVSDTADLHQVFEMTERMLKVGTEATALGELSFDGVNIVLGIPRDGAYHFLTTDSVSTIEAAMEDHRITSKVFGIIFGSLAMTIVCCYLYRRWQSYQSRMRHRAVIELFEMVVPDDDLPYAQRCVVCRYYARDIVLMPCRHFCLCRACLLPMNKHCPVCRAYFRTSIAVYVA